MTLADARWVLLDTDVWSKIYARSRQRARDTDIEELRTLLVGRSVAVATQTRAEVLAGLAQRDVGAARRSLLLEQLDKTTTVPVTEDVITAYADLQARCFHRGHALHQKRHTGDRWVAATAIAMDIPLLALDGIYRGVPGVPLFSQ
jgi:predicted nucleic acid-binding protein